MSYYGMNYSSYVLYHICWWIVEPQGFGQWEVWGEEWEEGGFGETPGVQGGIVHTIGQPWRKYEVVVGMVVPE